MAWDEANYWCKIYLHFSQHIGNKLTSDDLGCVLEEVLDVSAQWYPLGLQLKVRTGTLDRIQTQFPTSRDQLLEMLKTWLITSDNTSWKTLIDALPSFPQPATSYILAASVAPPSPYTFLPLSPTPSHI